MPNRKSSLLLAFIILFISFSTLFAQKIDTTFAGKWNVLIKETPQGDFNIPMRFEIVDNKISGFFTDPESKEELPMSEVNFVNEKLTAALSLGNYDLTFDFTKKDDNHIIGSLMGSFEVIGTRNEE